MNLIDIDDTRVLRTRFQRIVPHQAIDSYDMGIIKSRIAKDILNEAFDDYYPIREMIIHIGEMDTWVDTLRDETHFMMNISVKEIVRCKDCDFNRCGTCIKGWRSAVPNDSCDMAVRKTEEGGSLEL